MFGNLTGFFITMSTSGVDNTSVSCIELAMHLFVVMTHKIDTRPNLNANLNIESNI